MSFVVNQQLFELIDGRFRFHNLNIPSGCDTKQRTNTSYQHRISGRESPSPLRRQRQASSSKQQATSQQGGRLPRDERVEAWRTVLAPSPRRRLGGGAPLPPAGEAKTTDGGRSFPRCKRTPTRPDGETFQSREDHPASSLKPEPPSPLRRLTPYPRLPATVLSPWQGDISGEPLPPAGDAHDRPDHEGESSCRCKRTPIRSAGGAFQSGEDHQAASSKQLSAIRYPRSEKSHPLRSAA